MSPWHVQVVFTVVGLTACAASVRAQQFVNAIQVPGEARDAGPADEAPQNRLGAFGSDLAYAPETGDWFGLVDRGPGGGVLPYPARVQEFRLDVDRQTGAISGFVLLRTVLLHRSETEFFDGRQPRASDVGGERPLGSSLDPEGIAWAGSGDCFIADEYGPSVWRFSAILSTGDATGTRTGIWTARRLLETPENLRPVDELGIMNFAAKKGDDPGLARGRAANRGFEGLARSPRGDRLYAVLQSPLVDEGPGAEGERGRWVRIVEFDTATERPLRQLLYELESVDDINRRIADETAHFPRSKQGRAVGVSALVALDDHRLLLLERDNRGVGIDNPTGADPVLGRVGSKRVYEIDLSEATDASRFSLRNLEALPTSMRPVSKRLFLDLHAEIEAQGLPTPEKFEGLAIGPRLDDGDYLLLVATDNDFSVTQPNSSEPLDVYTDGHQGPVGADSQGRALLPTWLYAFKVALP